MMTWIQAEQSLLIILSILVLAVLIYGLVIVGLILSAKHEHLPSDIDYMIILGAQVSRERPTFPSPQLKERLETALAYIQQNPHITAIVTGGKGANEAEPEADVMARYLVERGVAINRIIVENQSTTTIENFTFALKMVETDTAIIVTNDYHMYRAKRTAKQNGLKTVYALAAPARSGNTPKAYLREILALGYHLIFTR